jgi:hypothetical protein
MTNTVPTFVEDDSAPASTPIDITRMNPEELQAYIDNLQAQLAEAQALINNTPQ